MSAAQRPNEWSTSSAVTVGESTRHRPPADPDQPSIRTEATPSLEGGD